MGRKNDNPAAKPKIRSRPKAKKKNAPGGKRPKTPADEEAVVSRSIMRRHSGRGGRGR